MSGYQWGNDTENTGRITDSRKNFKKSAGGQVIRNIPGIMNDRWEIKNDHW